MPSASFTTVHASHNQDVAAHAKLLQRAENKVRMLQFKINSASPEKKPALLLKLKTLLRKTDQMEREMTAMLNKRAYEDSPNVMSAGIGLHAAQSAAGRLEDLTHQRALLKTKTKAVREQISTALKSHDKGKIKEARQALERLTKKKMKLEDNGSAGLLMLWADILLPQGWLAEHGKIVWRKEGANLRDEDLVDKLTTAAMAHGFAVTSTDARTERGKLGGTFRRSVSVLGNVALGLKLVVDKRMKTDAGYGLIHLVLSSEQPAMPDLNSEPPAPKLIAEPVALALQGSYNFLSQ